MMMMMSTASSINENDLFCTIYMLCYHSFRPTKQLKMTTRSSAIAETARVTIRSVIAIDRLTLTVSLNMT